MNRNGDLTRIDHLNEEVERLTEERTAYRETVLFLARCLGKALAERDRARETAVFLEQLVTSTSNEWTPED